MKPIPLFDLNRQNKKLRKKVLSSIEGIYDTSAFTYGSETEQFEKSFAKLCKTQYAIGVHSGTDALILALTALGIGQNDEVITTPCTFSASADCIVHVGAKPVFVDVDQNYGNINPKLVEAAISKKTKAILVVHLYGIPCDMSSIKKISRKHKLKIIEDASHAHGSLYKNRPVGSLGDIACFSLYPSKSLGAIGNAGVVTTNSKRLAKRVRMFANHGIKSMKSKYLHHVHGYNKLIDNIQSAVLNHKLPLLQNTISTKLEIAKRYNQALQKVELQPMKWPDITRPSLYIFAFQTNKRKQLQKYFEIAGIATGIYYPIPLHLQPSMKYLGYAKGNFPNAERFFKNTLSLPIFSELTQNEINRIISAILKFPSVKKS